MSSDGDRWAQMRAVVRGRVQGVGFRYHTHQVAEQLLLHGFVRNLPDGAVEVVAAGPRAQVGRLLEDLHRGPVAARVETVTVEWDDPTPIEARFTIRA